jgi:hypothetical protein
MHGQRRKFDSKACNWFLPSCPRPLTSYSSSPLPYYTFAIVVYLVQQFRHAPLSTYNFAPLENVAVPSALVSQYRAFDHDGHEVLL